MGREGFTTEWLEKWANKRAAANRGPQPHNPTPTPRPDRSDRPKLERRAGDGANGETHVEGGDTGPDSVRPDSSRFLLRITSHRKRLIDEDNAACTYLTNALRYAGVIPDDNPGICKIVWSQQKVSAVDDEKTVIEVFPPGQWP